jgi:hypothetical protein
MNTAIRTSLLCDTIPFPDFSRVRAGSQTAVIDDPIESPRPLLAMAKATGTPGTQLATYTVFGSQVTTTLRGGKPVVSFYLNCSLAHRISYPAAQIIESRIIGQCGGHDLVEFTIVYQS